MPENVARLLDKIQARFLWGGSEVQKKLYLVKLEEATKSKVTGGLGIRKLRMVNECLLPKWWWRYGCEDRSLWKSILISKYGSAGGRWAPFTEEGGQRSKLWGDILNTAISNTQLYSFFVENCEVQVGNGM